MNPSAEPSDDEIPDDEIPDDEILDTGPPRHRNRQRDRRMVIGLLAAMAAILAVVVVVRSNGGSTQATPARSPSSPSSAVPAPSSSAAIAPAPVVPPDRPDACPAGFECRAATTSTGVRAGVVQALVRWLGHVRSLRIVTRVRSPRGAVTTPRLFTRLVKAYTAYGPVVVYVYQAVTDGDAEFLPVSGTGQIVTLESVEGGYNVSIAIRVPPRRAPVSPRLTRLAADARLITLR